MEKEQISQGQPESSGFATPEDVSGDLEAHEVAQRGQQLLEVSRELNSSSKALLEQIEPIV